MKSKKRKKKKDGPMLCTIGIILVVVIGGVVFSYLDNKKLREMTAFHYTYVDEEYLGIKKLKEAESNNEVKEIAEDMCLQAVKSPGEIPEKYIDLISEKCYFIIGAVRTNDKDKNTDDYNIAYMDVKCNNDKAIVTYKTNYVKGSKQDYSDRVYYSKIYFEKIDGIWKVKDAFSPP